jgi:chromosome segregation ATPase
MLGEHG